MIGELRVYPDTTNLGEELRETPTQTTDDAVVNVRPRRHIRFHWHEATRFDLTGLRDNEWGVSVVTLGELRLRGKASGPEVAARRLSTY